MSVTGFTCCDSSCSVNGLGDHHMGDLLKPLLWMSLPYKALWVISIGPSPSVGSLGLKREDMAAVVSLQICNLLASWWFLVPHSLFMVECHLG